MALNPTQTLVVSDLSPSQFETEVTFTATVTDPNAGPNAATAPIGTVNFVADGSFGFGSGALTPLTASITAVVSTLTVATFQAANNFAAGQLVTIAFILAPHTQFNGNWIVASANASSFTVNGSWTVTPLTGLTQGTATITNASQASASTTVLIVGIHSIVATYLGDPTPVTGHIGSPSNTLSQQVTAVAATNVVEVPGFALLASFSTMGDTGLPPQATLYAVPSIAAPHASINLLWNTLNVAYVQITGNNHVDYQPTGFTTPLISTTGSGIYVVSNGFTANITLTLQAFDVTQTPLAGVTSVVTITIT